MRWPGVATTSPTRRAWPWPFPLGIRWEPMGCLSPLPPMGAAKPLLLEAQRNKISHAGQEGLEKRWRSTASAAAQGWAKAPEVSLRRAAETSGDGVPVKR